MTLGSMQAPLRGRHGKNIKKKIFFSETIWPRAFICCVDQCIILSFINAANGAPGVHTGHAPGMSLSTRLLMETYEKIFSATAGHKACIFDIQHCHVELCINPANLAPGVKCVMGIFAII